ncbi:MAG: Omp28-related outer membrane protein [Chitinophagales bacterium]
MKSLNKAINICAYILLYAVLFFTTSCEELPPYIAFNEPIPIDLTCKEKANIDENEFSKTNTSFVSSELPEAQCKMVLIEEFSGVRCVRCPEGHQKVADLLESHPNEVAAITMHAGYLSEPYPENRENYVLEEGVFLYELFQGIALPAAAIDRTKYKEEEYVAIVNKNAWAGKVNERLQITAPMNLYTHYEYNPLNRELQIFVRAYYLENFDASSTHLLSVSLSESNIIDYQLVPLGETSSKIQPDYQHNHVLRTMLTPPTGITLDVDKVKGMVVERIFNAILPNHWKVEDMEIIAFVHDGTTNNVLQTAKKHIE